MRDWKAYSAWRVICRAQEDCINKAKHASDIQAWRSERERGTITGTHAQRLQRTAEREKVYQRAAEQDDALDVPSANT